MTLRPRFSLIVATKDRTLELATLLRSLAEQRAPGFELIIVDQNPDHRLTALIHQWRSEIDPPSNGGSNCVSNCVRVQHLRCSPGVSRARNLGLLHSSGDILAFPDDDCWYLPDTLKNIDEWFRGHKEYGILCLGSRDELGRVSGNRWGTNEAELTRLNVFRASATYGYFLRRPSASIPLAFDESLGPGASERFGAGEDTDLLLQLMRHGIRGRFYPLLYVGHPLKQYASTLRAQRYGGGWGRVLAKHSLPAVFLGLTAFDFARAAWRMFFGDLDRASVLWAHGRGMIGAYFARES